MIQLVNCGIRANFVSIISKNIKGDLSPGADNLIKDGDVLIREFVIKFINNFVELSEIW